MELLIFLSIIGTIFADLNQTDLPELCSLPAESGMCMALFYRFAFNQTSGRCEQFVYGGCGGNANKFFTQDACEVACGVSQTRTPKTCTGEPETGECKAYYKYWYFNSNTRSCLPFVYGGCGGNGNRYETELECTQRCNGCPAYSHFNPCFSDCPLTCDNYQTPPQICNLMCRIGCECDAGYVLTRNGKCILPENCAVQNCQIHSIYKTCGTSCPLTCENYRNPPEICNAACHIGCECEEGYVLRENGTCILPEDCPVKTCPENSRFNLCGTSCPLTCENYRTPPEVCYELCIGGCECEPGYVLDEGGHCVLPENCSNNNSRLPFACQQDKLEGGCDMSFSRYFFNRTSEQCQEFTYKGCLGNDNNFQSSEDCDTVCRSSPHLPFACQQDKLDGGCDMKFSRHFYNRTSGQCQEFTYKGCLGNDNNFENMEDCDAVCQVTSNLV